MINLSSIRDKIVTGLQQYIDSPVILLEQNKPKPSYPFVAYKITTPYVKGPGHEIEIRNLVPSDNPEFDYDFEETKIDQPTFTISFTAYSKDSLESQQLALKARDWINHIGYYDLKQVGVIVVTIQAVSNRDTLIVDDYERRNGFDVIFRTVNIVKRRLETIEDYSLNRIE